MNARSKARFVYDKMGELYPDAGCELNFRNELELLVSIMLSQQATDLSVNRLTTSLFQKYQKIEDYAKATETEMQNDIKTIGLYRNKAKNLIAMSKEVIARYEGIIPKNRELLEELPGIGRKTAGVFLAEWMHEPHFPVDTHVKRVSWRLGFSKEKDDPDKVEAKLEKLYDPSEWITAHHRFLFFGRYHCTARNPRCKECVLIKECKHPLL